MSRTLDLLCECTYCASNECRCNTLLWILVGYVPWTAQGALRIADLVVTDDWLGYQTAPAIAPRQTISSDTRCNPCIHIVRLVSLTCASPAPTLHHHTAWVTQLRPSMPSNADQVQIWPGVPGIWFGAVFATSGLPTFDVHTLARHSIWGDDTLGM